MLLDDQWTGAQVTPLVHQTRIEINEFFSCGAVVAFHIAQHGGLIPDSEIKGTAGAPVYLHMAGMVKVAYGKVVSGRIIRNRLELSRRLAGR